MTISKMLVRLGKGNEILVTLPHTFTRDSLYILIGALKDALTKNSLRIIFDFKNLERIQVGGVAGLSNMIEFCKKAQIKIEFKNTEQCGSATFLKGIGFSDLYFGLSSGHSLVDDQFLKLKSVEYDDSHSYLNTELVPWISRALVLDVRSLSSLKICFEEIFNNIKDHSTVNVGCSCGHYDLTEKKITICISDFGVGIPKKVRSKIKIGSDQAAIAMACQEGFTTRSTPGNRGAGLFVLIRNVVTRNSGTVSICSGTGIYSCSRAPHTGTVKPSSRAAPYSKIYPGTLIYVTLPVEKFVPSEIDEEEFVWD